MDNNQNREYKSAEYSEDNQKAPSHPDNDVIVLRRETFTDKDGNETPLNAYICSINDKRKHFYLVDCDDDPDIAKIYRMLQDRTKVACIDKKVAANYGRKICNEYCEAVQLHDEAEVAKSSGYMGSGSVIKVPRKYSYTDPDSMLKKIASSTRNDDAINEFCNLLGMVEKYGGQKGKVYKEYLVLRYINYYTFKQVVELWSDRYSRAQVGEISKTAHLLVAYLTSSVPVHLKERRFI